MARIKNNLTGDVFEALARDFANEPDFTIVDSSTPITADVPPVAVSGVGEPVTPASAPAEQASSGSTGTPVNTPSSDPVSTQTTAPVSEPSITPQDGTAPSVPGDAGNVSSTVTGSGTTTVPTTTPVDTSVIDTTPVTVDAASSPSTASTSSDGTDPNVGAQSSGGSPSGSLSGDAGNVLAPDAQNGSGASSATAENAATQPSNASVTVVVTPPTDSATGNPTGGPTPGNGATLDERGKHIVADQLEADMLFAIAQIITPNDSIKHAADAFFDQVRSQIDVEATR